MIHEEICTYEVAKLAKDKGFNEKCYHYYQKGVLESDGCFNRYNKGVDSICAAPTQSLLQQWLREEKGIVIDVVLDWQYNIEVEEIRYQHRIGSNRRMTIGGVQTRGIVCGRYFDTYELALEDALKYALEYLV